MGDVVFRNNRNLMSKPPVAFVFHVLPIGRALKVQFQGRIR